jgi:tRNA-Thr(GGU) m(6)t(6)A37 methyltransferase TsaA
MTRATGTNKPPLPPRLEPIGFMRSTFTTKFSAPHQPDGTSDEINTIELCTGKNFEQALRDIEGFSRIWLIWWFHANSGWKPLVRPPRGGSTKRGLFATRSPHRPNPLGLTAVELKGVSGRRLTIGACDLLDGTPILDIKPYIPAIDAFPDAATGWLETIPTTPRFTVVRSQTAACQATWLREEFGLDFLSRVETILAVDPSPHRTRRIAPCPDGFRIGCGGWRVYFTVNGITVQIERLAPGYPERYLADPNLNRIPDRAAQRAFRQRWLSSL